MAFELNKFQKYTKLMIAVGFYQVYAKKYPLDPTGGMVTDVTALFSDLTGLWAKLKLQFANMGVLIALLIVSPMVMKSIGNKIGAFKIVLNAAVYYLIGDTLGKIISGTPGIAGANFGGQYGIRPMASQAWSQNAPRNTPQPHSAGTIRNIYGE